MNGRSEEFLIEFCCLLENYMSETEMADNGKKPDFVEFAYWVRNKRYARFITPKEIKP